MDNNAVGYRSIMFTINKNKLLIIIIIFVANLFPNQACAMMENGQQALVQGSEIPHELVARIFYNSVTNNSTTIEDDFKTLESLLHCDRATHNFIIQTVIPDSLMNAMLIGKWQKLSLIEQIDTFYNFVKIRNYTGVKWCIKQSGIILVNAQNMVDQPNKTALMDAAESGDKTMVEFLLAHNASKHIKYKSIKLGISEDWEETNKTAHDFALENGHKEIAQLLRR